MTICISSICDNGHTVITASDRMVTTNRPPIEFEHTKEKIFTLSETCIALTAGNALRPIEIIPMIANNVAKGSGISDIANSAKKIYQVLRSNHAEDEILRPRSITKEVFYTQGASIFPHGLFQAIDADFSRYSYGLMLLITGVDSFGHIFSVSDPGVLLCYDTIGFHATGVGDLHATQVFIAHNYKTTYSLEEALTVVYAAKKAAEVAPGVGRATDIKIIQRDRIIDVSAEVIDEIDKIYMEEKPPPVEQIRKKSTRLKKFIDDINKPTDTSQPAKKEVPDVPETEGEGDAKKI